MAKTLYQMLNVDESASDNDLWSAFKTLERELPDSHDVSAIETLDRIREAFAILSNPIKRSAYNKKLAASRLPPAITKIKPRRTFGAWLRKPGVLIALIASFALAIYWNLETQKIRRAENARIAEQQGLTARIRKLEKQAQQTRQDHQSAMRLQNDLDAQRAAAEQALIGQANDDYRRLGEQQLNNQANSERQALHLIEKQTDADLRRQELDMAEKQLDLQYHRAALRMDLKMRMQEDAEAAQQRALRQHEANQRAIKDLWAAKYREYDRQYYGSGGISTANPAYHR